MIHQLGSSILKRLPPPAKSRTEREKFLALLAATHRITRLDVAFAIVVLLDLVLTFVDAAASGQQVVHSLIYPPGELTIWASPIYMPLTWMVTLTYLGYLGWRFAILICGLLGAIDIPLFEEMSYYGDWWRYTPTHFMLGHTPAYVSLFEGLIVATLPLLFDRIERRSWLETAAVGVLIGAWMAVAALTAWLLLGH